MPQIVSSLSTPIHPVHPAMAHRPPPTSLNLPLEIRFQIYEHLLPPLTIDCKGGVGCEGYGVEFLANTLFSETSCVELLLTRICRQILYEIYSLYFARYHIHILIYEDRIFSLDPCGFPGVGLPLFHEVLCEKPKEYPRYLDWCRNVVVWVDWSCGIKRDEENWSAIAKLLVFLSTLKQVQRAKIHFNQDPLTASVFVGAHGIGGDSSSEMRLIETMQKGLDSIPGLQEYRVEDRFSPVICSRGLSWRDEHHVHRDRNLRWVLGDDILK